MQVMKIAGNIYKAKMTKREEEAMHRAIQDCVAEYDRKNQGEIDAMVMMILHMEFGYGKDRLKRFHNAFIKRMAELCIRYEAPVTDQKFLATEWCKEYGIDLEEWGREFDALESERRMNAENEGNGRGQDTEGRG